MKFVFVLLSIACVAGQSQAQQRTDSAGFVTVLGRDTVALENFRQKGQHLEGDILIRVPGTVLLRYALDIKGDGSIAKSVVEIKPVGAPDVPRRKVSIEFSRDSARVSTDSAGERSTIVRSVKSGTWPALTTGFGSSLGIYVSLGMYEALLGTLPRKMGDTVAVPVIGAVNGRVGVRKFIRRSTALVDVDYFQIAWIHMDVDGEGRIQHVDASETTEKTTTRRVGMLDMASALKNFAARDAKGQGLGIASPADSARITLGGAHIAVDYSSPRLRGRNILGETVPYGQVWRTGANAATVFRTDRELMLGGVRIPAGAYSLWTLPKADGVELIVNQQHGQWGTEYHPAIDLARVPLTLSRPDAARENFAIRLVENGSNGGGELRIEWGVFAWSVPIVVR
jgi:hypothetical protein